MPPDISEPTIAAIATPPGIGGIGIIRISGSQALAVLKRLFKPRRPVADFVSHKMYYGWAVNPVTQAAIDEVLAVFMQAPLTYTREDVVELHCHGSYLILQNILAQILKIGIRLAEPGEFTKRAFLNGRLDLTQAEAVLEILTAKTQKSLNLAISRLQGHLHDRVWSIRDTLIDIRAILEVAIDFPEDDVDILESDNLASRIANEVQAPLKELIVAADRGKIFREGVAVVILGRPNVGKSSLLNALLREERAIVTPVPGTTRDTIEEYLDIKGLPVRIIDTAGIRESGEAVEQIGIQRARQKMSEADLVLLLLDAAEPLTDEDHALVNMVAAKPVIIIVNKADLVPDLDLQPYSTAFPNHPLIAVSAKTLAGFGQLESLIYTTVTGGALSVESEHLCVPNARHKAALVKALAASEQVVNGLAAKQPADLIAIDLQTTLDCLAYIVGQTTPDDVLDRIFDQFCIGK